MACCLRNAAAVARYANAHFSAPDICVVAAGERWPDQSLRPALEDEIGAGAVLDVLDGPFTAEAEAVRATYRTLKTRSADLISACMSGRELDAAGFEADVEMALALNVSENVPVLVNGEFVAVAPT